METQNTKKTCRKCGRSMNEKTNFYLSKDKSYLPICKKCMTMHINIFNESTIKPLCRELDIPFISHEWDVLVDRYKDNPKTSATAIFGRYLSKMKLSQYKDYTYKDTERFLKDSYLQEIEEIKKEEEKINKYRATLEEEVGESIELESEDIQNIDFESMSSDGLAEFLKRQDEKETQRKHNEDMFYSDLTPEDRAYLIGKWGRTYTIAECIILEKLFLEMVQSYEINTASHMDYLLKICRLSLKIDQSLEVNDIDGFNKLVKVYDMLMKSAKFTAQQNLLPQDEVFDSISELTQMCEEDGEAIPRYHSERQDVVDITIANMNNYTKKLVMDDLNLSDMIEGYLNKMTLIAEEQQKNGKVNSEDGDEFYIDLDLDIDYKDADINLSEEDSEDDDIIFLRDIESEFGLDEVILDIFDEED